MRERNTRTCKRCRREIEGSLLDKIQFCGTCARYEYPLADLDSIRAMMVTPPYATDGERLRIERLLYGERC